jgi:hypothetical protein
VTATTSLTSEERGPVKLGLPHARLPCCWPSSVEDSDVYPTPGTTPAERAPTPDGEGRDGVRCSRKSPGPSGLNGAGTECTDFAQDINVMTEASEDEEEILAADEIEIEVAADTGAGAHCCNPRHIPNSVEVVCDQVRNFNGAGGEAIKHWGRASVRMEQEDGRHISQEVQVMEVTRPLHSISTVCDNEHDVVFTKTEGLVLPAGLLDEVLAMVRKKVVARYKRKGGLYVAKMRVKDPRAKRPSPAKASPFAGRGAKR